MFNGNQYNTLETNRNATVTIKAMNNVVEQKEKDETTFNRSYHK